jgi:splicing factor 3B subunit 4
MSSLFPPSLTSLFERNQEATCYIGNMDSRVNDEILWELFIQCGPVVNVHIPKDKITGEHQGFGFVEFRTEEDAEYAIKIMHMIKLYGKPIKVNKASQDKRTQEVGANIFVGNLSEEIDEKGLKDIFTTFGVVLSTKIMRDLEAGSSKHYGFVSFDNFESSDEAIKKMNGQYVSGKPIEVSYAYKKDTKGERHGSVAERVLAANRPTQMYQPMFSENQQTYVPNMVNNEIRPPMQGIQMGMPNMMMPGMGMMPKMPGMPNIQGMNMMPNMMVRPPMHPPGMPMFVRPPMNPPNMNHK